MKYLFSMLAVLLLISAAPAQTTVYNNGYYGQPQATRLTPHDQQQFDKYYAKWVDATRKGDQDDITDNAGKMQAIMAKYNIPSTVAFDQIASGAASGVYPSAAYPAAGAAYPTRLSAVDQRAFDTYYTKWVDATRKNDHDDIASNAGHMQEIMARYGIPNTVPFDQIASAGVTGYPASNATGAYPAAPAYSGRLSPDDQRSFDSYYSKWVDATRKNDRDDIAANAGHMQEIMARYGIAASTPFQAIASNGYAAGAYAAPNPAYAYPSAVSQRLSGKDQKDFDNAYKHWVDARRKKDMDDVDKNARKMEDIMARYNIPANTPFDQVATSGVGYRH